MAENTKIEWADHTWNPWEGCQKVGAGCDHCYAETHNARFAGGTAINWGPGAPRRRTSPANWRKPLAWNANHEAFFAEHGRRQRVFCASLGDVFDNAVDLNWRDDLFALINATPNLDWLLLTKRIGNVPAMVSIIEGWMPLNVWLGATITSQAEADRDIPKLLAVPARVRFLSMEPLLGPVDLGLQRHANEDDRQDMDGYCSHITTAAGAGIHWVIVGGESGPGARPMHPDWARSLRDQCQAAGVAFHYKQHGEWLPIGKEPGEATRQILAHARPEARCYSWPDGETLVHVGKKAAGRLLDGRTWDEFPSP